MEATAELRRQIKEMLVSKLRLRLTPAEIADDQPLIGEGLGLDSIDVLEVVAAIEKQFGVVIQSQQEGERVLKSVDSIVAFILEKGYKPA